MAGDTQYKKFMFDTDFDELAEMHRRARAKQEAGLDQDEPENAEPEPEPEPEAPTFSEEDMARAREEALLEGKRLGAEEAAAATEQKISDTLSAISGKLQEMFDSQAAAHEEQARQAISVAATLVRKLFPTLNAQTAEDQVEAMLRSILGPVSGESEIIVRVPESLAADLADRIEAVAEISGFRGDMKILADPALSIGDCSLEWSSGGVARSAKELAKQLDEIIARNLGDAIEAETEQAAEADVSAEPAAPAPPVSEAMPELHPEPAPEQTTEAAPLDQPPVQPEPMPAMPAPTPAPVMEEAPSGPAPVPSQELMSDQATVTASTQEIGDNEGHAPVPADDLAADTTTEEAPAEPETPQIGGADLELENDLKD